MKTIKYLTAVAIMTSVPAVALAESEDSLAIQMAATVEDVCTVAFNGNIQTFTGGGPGSTGFSAVVGSDEATLDFAFEIGNTDDPLTDTIGDVSDVTGNITAQFFCNGAYSATIQAANGAFLNGASLGAGVTNTGDFSNALGYTITSTFLDLGDAPDSPLGLTLNATGTPLQLITETGSQYNGQILFAITTGQANVINPATATVSELHNLIAGLYTEAMTISFVQDGVIPPISFDTAAPAAQTAL